VWNELPIIRNRQVPGLVIALVKDDSMVCMKNYGGDGLVALFRKY